MNEVKPILTRSQKAKALVALVSGMGENTLLTWEFLHDSLDSQDRHELYMLVNGCRGRLARDHGIQLETKTGQGYLIAPVGTHYQLCEDRKQRGIRQIRIAKRFLETIRVDQILDEKQRNATIESQVRSQNLNTLLSNYDSYKSK